ncbi:MAG: hypothetical protein ACYC1C_07085 [Chloroflexota bacterium]
MGGTFTVLKWGLRNWYDEMIMFTAVGFLSALMLVPFAAVAFLVFGLLQLPVVVLLFVGPFLPGPALVGLHALARELARNEGISWSLFWGTTRQYLWKSLALFAISFLATVTIMTSMRFYMASDNVILQWVGFAWLYGLILWSIMQMYLLPLLLEQERFNLLLLYRNALIVTAAKPVVSLVVLIVSGLLLLAGYFTVVGLPLLVIPIMAVLANHALRFAVYGPPKPLE